MTARPPITRLQSTQRALNQVETDPAHHLTGPFLPQTPLEQSPEHSRVGSPVRRKRVVPGFVSDLTTFRWVVVPESALKLLSIPVALFAAWEALAPLVAPGAANPFAPLLFISHRVPGSLDSDPRYQKGWLDLAFIAYHVIVWSFVRQAITLTLATKLARRYGIRKPAKRERFGEQLYATVYFGFFGTWGLRIMSQLPTWWYKTENFWIGYPHWDMQPELKRYYLMHASYWCQQAIVMLFGLEKPRKDYYELIAHHIVTLWLIGWSYLINLTRIGGAVYLSMDFPDAWLALTKVLNYMRFERAQIVAFVALVPAWTYFRIWLNISMLRSVWTEFDLIPAAAKQWYPPAGVWLVWWMKYQIFVPLVLLLALNLFWYFLILRIGKRALSEKLEDERSDDEGDGEDEDEDSKEE